MQVRELQVPGAFEFTPVQHGDDRGLFLEWFKIEKLVEAVGHPMTLAQANLSVSRAGTLRGVHFADVPPGQAKYVSCPRGAVHRLRGGRPGRLTDVRCRPTRCGWTPSTAARSISRRASDMPSSPWRTTRRWPTCAPPGTRRAASTGSTPVDPELGLALPDGVDFLLSDKDTAAPTLAAGGGIRVCCPPGTPAGSTSRLTSSTLTQVDPHTPPPEGGPHGTQDCADQARPDRVEQERPAHLDHRHRPDRRGRPSGDDDPQSALGARPRAGNGVEQPAAARAAHRGAGRPARQQDRRRPGRVGLRRLRGHHQQGDPPDQPRLVDLHRRRTRR